MTSAGATGQHADDDIANTTFVLGKAPSMSPVLDFYSYLQGCWKRNLQWREFGGSFRHMRSSNALVFVEADASSGGTVLK